ncbi:DNA polymerase [Bacillus phage W.Ph.]|uniref:Gp85 n=1 Tax=Bacillus phage W.Ph. TaxID=764595 RepID=G9B1I6_9CAUD|nr:DNA polymerase [Bacillus phage W.Ph.]ADH03231.1 gp85 [Bacillus phage W.Ph.]
MKIMFALDHIREEHFKQKRGTNELEFNYHNTEAGKTLGKLVGKKGLDLSKDQWCIDYAYKRVPKVKARNRNKKAVSYVPPTQKETKPLYDEFAARIIKDKPDVIVPMGNMSCKAILGKAEISKLRGVPRREIITSTLTEESHECWVMPMYSMEYLIFAPKITNLVVADMGILKKYVEEGYSAFMPKKVNYEDATTIERVREIFTKEIVNAPVVAWDLETNTLSAEKIGAKPLCISLSWREGQGVTIPLQHKCFTWNLGELAEIYKFIEEFVGSNQIKVGHNI